MAVEEYQPFPLAVLPEPLQSFVRNTAVAIGCDPAMVALPTLVGVAAAVGTTRRLVVKPGWREACVLWGMVVSRPGSKKTPALKSALRPVFELQSRLGGAGSSVPAPSPDAAGGDGGREVSCQLENRSIPGHIHRVMTTDVSIAALADILVSEPRGILAVRDELAGWLGDLRKRAGRSDVSQWLSAWSAEPWIVDRYGRDSILIPAAAVSVFGGIQPNVLPRVVSTTDQGAGLLDRFLFVVPPPPPADHWTDACEDPEDGHMMDLVFSKLYGLADRRDLTLDCKAKERFAAFVNENGQLAAGADDAVASMLSKFPSHVARIAMTLQLAKWAVEDGPQDSVDDLSMRSAIDLAVWFAGQAWRVLDLMDGNSPDGSAATDSDNEEAILGALREIGGSGTIRDLQRSTGRRFQTADQILSVLERLVADGRVRAVPDTRSGPGPKPTRYELTS